VTAFEDRAVPAYRRLSAELAWGSFAWFATEPDHVVFYAGSEFKLDVL